MTVRVSTGAAGDPARPSESVIIEPGNGTPPLVSLGPGPLQFQDVLPDGSLGPVWGAGDLEIVAVTEAGPQVRFPDGTEIVLAGAAVPDLLGEVAPAAGDGGQGGGGQGGGGQGGAGGEAGGSSQAFNAVFLDAFGNLFGIAADGAIVPLAVSPVLLGGGGEGPDDALFLLALTPTVETPAAPGVAGPPVPTDPPVVNEAVSVVAEAALADGSGKGPVGIGATGTGTLPFDNGTISDLTARSGPGSAAVTKAVTPTTITLSADDGSWTITVDRASGDYEFTLLDDVAHGGAGADRAPVVFDFTASNAAGDSVGPLMVNIVDDVPMAVELTDAVSTLPNTNLVIVFDRSGSTREDPGVQGFAQRIDLMRAALSDMLTEFANVGALNIKVVQFNTRASSTDWFSGADAIQDALAFLDSLRPAGGTSYGAAIDEVIDEFGTPPGAPGDGFQNLLLFLTDGNPNPGRGLTATDIANYQQLAADNEITAYAVGVGDGVTASNPSFVAIGQPAIPDGPMQNPVVVADDALAEALLDRAPEPATAEGNVLAPNQQGEVAVIGADEPGGIQSIEVDGNIYVFDATPDRILLNGVLFAAGSQLTVNTALGGELRFDFATGDYAYQAPTGTSAAQTERFAVTLQDAEGDRASADLIIEVTPGGPAAALPRPLTGDADDNTLTSGAFDEIMTGGDGSDSFVVSVSDAVGDDRVTDFDSTADILRITDVIDQGGVGLDLADLVAAGVTVTDDGTDVTVTLGGGSITLEGIGGGGINDLVALDAAIDLEIAA